VTAGTVISSILSIVLALGFVLAMAWGTIFLLKKWQDRQMGEADADGADWSIRFLRALPLGQRERVALIEVRGETMLIGITAGSMSVLSRWPAPPEPSEIEKAYRRAEAAADHLPDKPGKGTAKEVR
jgi:flagellar protein FliO/FliZ